jgi:hypothetical protein
MEESPVAKFIVPDWGGGGDKVDFDKGLSYWPARLHGLAGQSLDFLYFYCFSMVRPRETREGWPLLTIETEKNGDSQSTNQRGSSLVGSLSLSCRYRRFFLFLDCSSQPSIKYFFPHRTLLKFLCPNRPASWAGSRAGSPVSQYVSLVRPQYLLLL